METVSDFILLASVARPTVVANADGKHHRDTPAPTEREVDHDRPGAQANVEGPLPSRRISFIREFALREGISAEALDAIWGAGKHGYIASYDPHFVRFESYHRQIAAGTGRFRTGCQRPQLRRPIVSRWSGWMGHRVDGRHCPLNYARGK